MKLMRKRIILIVSIAAAAVVLVTAGIVLTNISDADETYRNVKILETEGTVDLLRDEKTISVYEQMVIRGGDIISTGADGRADLSLDDDKYAVIEPSSEVEFELKGEKNNGEICLHLNSGAIYNEIDNPIADEDGYSIETPDGVMAVRGTKFRVAIEKTEDGLWRLTTIYVFEGSVYIKVDNSDDEDTLITAGEEAAIEKYFGNEQNAEKEARLRKSGGSIDKENLPDYLIERLGNLLSQEDEEETDENAGESEEETEKNKEEETKSAAENIGKSPTGLNSETIVYIDASKNPSVETETKSVTKSVKKTEKETETEAETETDAETENETDNDNGTETETESAIQVVAIPDEDETVYTYNGESQTYTLAISDFYSISGNVQTDAGEYTVSVELTDTENYQWSDGTTDAKTYTFTIKQREVTLEWSAPENLVYDGWEKYPTVIIGNTVNDDMFDETMELSEGYTEGIDNVNAGRSFSYTLTELYNDNYCLPSDTTSPVYTITAKEIDSSDFILSAADDEDGIAVTVTPTSSNITEGNDYTWSYIDEEFTVTITGTGNCTGTLTFYIEETPDGYTFVEWSNLAQNMGLLSIPFILGEAICYAKKRKRKK